MGYAQVCVNSPLAQCRVFTYSIPSHLQIEIGQAVWVPFGPRVLQGIVLEITEQSPVDETREIAGIIEPRPIMSLAHVSLARWLSEYYLSPFFDAVALMLPPGFERRALTFISLSTTGHEREIAPLGPEYGQAYKLVERRGRIGLAELETAFGKKKAQKIVSQLVSQGLAVRDYELEPVKVGPKEGLYLSLAASPDEARQEIDRLRRERAIKQAALLDFLVQRPGAAAWAEASHRVNCDKAVADALASRGLVKIERRRVRREPIADQGLEPSPPLVVTSAQESALKNIRAALLGQDGDSPSIFLLHGVTGSGKTEVYLQALAETVKLGKRGIVLVPEISLTPQTIERFAARFPGRVAVIHSKLSLGEQFDEWQRIRDGEFDVVIGPRSAIFAPQPNLGLIVIDEEHEWTYKQHDKTPRYHARKVALKLAELTGATAVLGSATPDIETFYHAQRGDYHLLQLPQRVTPDEASPLPEVEIVDLKDELKAGNRGLFSRSLSQAVAEAITNRGQVILFLNRRGAATFIQCRSCGFVVRCKRCEVALTYHLAGDTLICHQCNHRLPVPSVCPRCLSRRIKFLGTGTQKLEQEAGYEFPQARLMRWDSDVTQKSKNAHQEILSKFRAHEADILIGTQMIAKGLDLPLVTVVGVVSADTILNVPDFRAGERTFQLLCQVAGRAGRGPMGGRVFIQTYSPGHYAIQAAARHDYAAFYLQEIEYRRQLQDPPFRQLARLVYSHVNEARCQRETERMKQLLASEVDSRGIADICIIGPAPAFIHRLRGRFRWQIILRGFALSAFLSQIPMPQGWVVDIDPVGL